MTEHQIRQRLIAQYNLRAGEAMCRYVTQALTDKPSPIPVIGHDARTGVPQRLIVDPQMLQETRVAS
jgi:hypothetical protein